MWDEGKKYFAPRSKRHPDVGTVAKDLAMADVNLGEFLTSKYSLWLDLRTSDDDSLHGSGRRIENASEDITIQITKKAEATGALNIYLFVVMDAQLNIEDGRFVSAASCRRRPIRRRYADRRGVEKQFSSWICWKAPTGGSFNTSWSCARQYGIIRPISSVPGSGRTPRFTFLTPVSDSTITCERSTMYLWPNRRCISSMTVQLRRR